MEQISKGDLNTVYNGEQMAVDVYERIIKDVKDVELKQDLSKLMQDHLKHMQDIEVYMDFAGIKPSGEIPFADMFVSFKLMFENQFKTDDEILKTAAQGERMGIDTYRKIYPVIKNREARELLENIINKDQRIAERLDSLAKTYKN